MALEEIDRTAPEAAKTITQALKAANARIDTGQLYSELGTGGENTDDPMVAVRAQAAEIRKADPQVSEADAMRRAMAESGTAAKALAERMTQK